jgi:hypothetical protein
MELSQLVPRWSVTWSALELYEPRTASKLASLRVAREKGKAERERQKWEADNPFLAWMERVVGEEQPK